MMYAKKAKNAEHLGLRSSISFFQLKDELRVNIQTIISSSNRLGKKNK